MPKKYGVKEKDLVISHVVNLILTGKLRSGDRLDRNEIALELGLSRVPVQEAIVQLENDGIVTTRYHRGAYLERFDDSAVHEHHELYGVLSGLASARAAQASDPEIVAALDAEISAMRGTRDSRTFDTHAREFRNIVNDKYAGPRLQAIIGSSQTLIPRAFWESYLGHRDELLPSYEAELGGIRGRDPAAATVACGQRATMMARILVAELIRRGVLPPAPVD